MKADIGAAVFDATNQHVRERRKGIDTTVERRMLIGERVANRLGDFGLEIVRKPQE